ncbi:hypothetical protein MRX96_025002 [Rhipicephalus microplus]
MRLPVKQAIMAADCSARARGTTRTIQESGQKTRAAEGGRQRASASPAVVPRGTPRGLVENAAPPRTMRELVFARKREKSRQRLQDPRALQKRREHREPILALLFNSTLFLGHLKAFTARRLIPACLSAYVFACVTLTPSHCKANLVCGASPFSVCP